MKITVLTAALGLLFVATHADARERLRSNERWCLETSTGGSSGGGTMFECRYRTRAQCMESKVAHGDHCTRNPRR